MGFISLASFLGRKKLNFRLVKPGEFAHCIIDVQRQYCDPRYSKYGTRKTNGIARAISRVTPVFRAAGMPTYMIYKQKWSEPPEQAFGGFHHVEPAETDILFGKCGFSAFKDTGLGDRLRRSGVKTLLISGFDIDCCVNASVQDALREEFNVWVLSDCTGNGGYPKRKHIENYRRLMMDNGAEIISSRKAILRLRNL